VTLEPAGETLPVEWFSASLLNELAAACIESGGSVIGHLKSVLHTSRGVMACNLTSLRGGAACTGNGGPEGEPLVLSPGEAALLDLAVLVYGIPAATADALARRILAGLLDPLAVRWSLDRSPSEQG
jgi:hypothetical protein